jgi:hypothetical protein
MSKSQQLNSLSTVNKRYIKLLLFWFHFLDLLIKFMKMTSCTAPPPLPRECKDLLFPSPFYMCRFTGPPPPFRPIFGEGEVGPSHGNVFGWRRERGETGITPPHAGWQRTQKILVLVTLMPHMQNGQGQNHPCFFVTFFILSKS